MGLERATGVAEDLLGPTVALDDFVLWSEWALARVGFRPSNCLPVVAACRDELMAGLEEEVTRTWGRPFQVGALGGLVFLGRTGVQAALGHAPGEDGRHRFVVFCLPHIGIDDDGVVGRVHRRGMHRGSTACGALAAYRADLGSRGAGSRARAGAGGADVDADDVEQSLLRRRLGVLLDEGSVPSLTDLTELARQAAVADIRRYVDLARGSEPVDVAYVSGIVVHLPEGADRVAGVEAEVVIDGRAMVLPH